MNKNIDNQEISKFSQMANNWWDKNGSFKLIHKLNPLRTSYVLKVFSEHSIHHHPAGLEVLDIGCGAGILCESLAKTGAKVTGLDMSIEALEAGALHAEQSQIKNITYTQQTAEEMASKKESYYNLITCMEMVEHVPDFSSILKAAHKMLKEDGILVMSTINRTFKAQLEIIDAVENILKWLPKGTHEYNKFITPQELIQSARSIGLEVLEVLGYKYNILKDSFYLSDDCSVNYLIAFKKVNSK